MELIHNIRSKHIDLNYHNEQYDMQRQQLVHCKIIQDIMKSKQSKQSSFLKDADTSRQFVCMAGAIGSGKSYVSKSKFPDINKFVVVNPDPIKELFPEYQRLIQEMPLEASTILQKEACYVSELLMWKALDDGYDILMDGTLKDHIFFTHLFTQIKKLYPSYKIQIIYVVVKDKETIYKRVAKRAIKTKRHIPRAVIDASIELCPKSIEILKHHVHAIETISNDDY